jgi:choline monooxygenase
LNAFDPTLPLELARTIPCDWYTDPAVYQRERTAVFGNSWQSVGRVDQLRKPGEFITAEIAGEPIAVVRGSDGILRAFFNVCRHRAAPVLTEESGCVGKLRCRYHGWTYDLAGKLVGTPEFEGVCDFEKSENGMVPVGAVREAGGFVWVHLAETAGTVEAEFPEFFADFTPHPPRSAATSPARGEVGFHARRVYEVGCNWKVYVDNYLDGGYHVNTVHPALAGAIDYKEYRTETHARSSVQTSPLKESQGSVGITRTGHAAYWWLYPNFMVNSYSGVLDTNLVLPIDVHRCQVVFDFYFGPEHDTAFREESIRVAEVVQEEDRMICEQVQRGLGSRSYSTGRFSVKREAGGYHFHRLLANSLI